MSADHSQPEAVSAMKHVENTDAATTIAPTNYTSSNRGSSLLVGRRRRSSNVHNQSMGEDN